MMPAAGLEPARYRYQRILSPSRLPIPSRRRNQLYYYSTSSAVCQVFFDGCTEHDAGAEAPAKQTVFRAEAPYVSADGL